MSASSGSRRKRRSGPARHPESGPNCHPVASLIDKRPWRARFPASRDTQSPAGGYIHACSLHSLTGARLAIASYPDRLVSRSPRTPIASHPVPLADSVPEVRENSKLHSKFSLLSPSSPAPHPRLSERLTDLKTGSQRGQTAPDQPELPPAGDRPASGSRAGIAGPWVPPPWTGLPEGPGGRRLFPGSASGFRPSRGIESGSQGVREP